MKYYIIAGEKSGDLHGSNLIKALKIEDPGAEIRCWGGDEMKEAGGDLAVHYREIAFMGFWEVATNLFTVLRYLAWCKKDIRSFGPDVIVLIDYAGFNMKIAKFAKLNGYKTFYYISPKVWAWNQSRALNIKKYVDRMFVILPFETTFFNKYDYKVDYVGNPLFDAINAFQINSDFLEENGLTEKPVIAVLPGSRKQEIANMLSVMLEVADSFPEYNFVVAGVDNVPESFYEQVKAHPGVRIVYNNTYNLLAHARAAVVTSGTATLETALFDVPQVVCYKTSTISYKIAKGLIKVDYISLVNLIAAKEVVKELIQQEMNSQVVATELKKIVDDSPERQEMLSEYKKLRATMGNEKASQNTARLIVKYLQAED